MGRWTIAKSGLDSKTKRLIRLALDKIGENSSCTSLFWHPETNDIKCANLYTIIGRRKYGDLDDQGYYELGRYTFRDTKGVTQVVKWAIDNPEKATAIPNPGIDGWQSMPAPTRRRRYV